VIFESALIFANKFREIRMEQCNIAKKLSDGVRLSDRRRGGSYMKLLNHPSLKLLTVGEGRARRRGTESYQIAYFEK